LVDGCLRAIIDIDKVIKIIRGSDDAQEAKVALIKSLKLEMMSKLIQARHATSPFNQDEQTLLT
jgi:DNA gyrase/topoisomerase IV subunit A